MRSAQSPTARFRAFLTGKVTGDLIWNYASLVILGISGIGLNVLIGRFYGAATLGAFNQVFAAYVIASMVASGGIHFSVLRAVVARNADPRYLAEALRGALYPTLLLAGSVGVAFYWSSEWLGELFQSAAAASGARAASAGLLFFALNKVLLATLNGLAEMRAFAIYQSLRYVLILGALVLAIFVDLPGRHLPVIFTVSELLLAGPLLLEVSRRIPWWNARNSRGWTEQHLRFGLRGGLSGMLVELNARVDVVMIGYFSSDAAVGAYSYAAFFAEGFFQLLVVLQNIYNPIFARHVASGELRQLESIIRSTRNRTYAAMIPTALVAIAIFPHLVRVTSGSAEFSSSIRVFAILVLGIASVAGFAPFQNALAMANLPGWQSLFMGIVVAVNAIGNACLIPLWGLDGAAVATSLASIAGVFVLRGLVARRVGVSL